MRANLPKQRRPDPNELNGPHLGAMQVIASRLMDTLPDGEDLWSILAQTEALLLAAQMEGTPVDTLFGEGDVESFCQSIIDEYKMDGSKAPDNQHQSPAADTVPRATKRRELSRRREKSRNSIQYAKKRRITLTALVALCLSVVLLVGWYIGLWNYLTGGSDYYLSELHNFEDTTIPIGSPIELTLPLMQNPNEATVIYADAENGTLTYRGLTMTEKNTQVENSGFAGSELEGLRPMRCWYIRIDYTVHASFTEVTYVEPAYSGKAVLTLDDGATYTYDVQWARSGTVSDGISFAEIAVMELPADVNTRNAMLHIRLDPPYKVVWKRLRTGIR